jgi:hypothetical protein
MYWESLTNTYALTFGMIMDEEMGYHRKMDLRTERYNVLRNEDKLSLGEINAQLAEDGFDEITAGAGLVCLPTKQHKILWEGKGVRKMIAS